MKQIFIALCIMLSLPVWAQATFEKSKDKDGILIYKGQLTIDDLNNTSSFDWFRDGVKKYKPSKVRTPILHQYLPHYNVLVFMGTWCDDSHVLVPKLIKTLQESAYPMQQLTIYGVDRAKLTTGNKQEPYHIELVPTIIVLKDGKEIGRITETVKKDIETDLLDIVEKDLAMSTPIK